MRNRKINKLKILKLTKIINKH